jgi:hypothetical protein
MWGRFNRRLAQDREFFELVLKLKVRVTALEEQITALEAGHERLRGKLYQSGAHKPPEAAPEAPRSKGEILRDYFVPGRPAKHSE